MKDLTHGSVIKNMIGFAVPLVLAGLLSQGFNLIDTVIAGRFLGTEGLAAIGATAPYITFASSALWGYGVGLSMAMAQRFGAKQYREILSVYRSNLVVFTAVILVISAVSIAFCDPILHFLNVDPVIFDDTRTYFILYMAGLTLVVFNNFGIHTLNAFGSSSFPLAMSVLSAVLNITGNLLSVTVFSFGVAGIAASTVLSAGVVDVCYAIKIRAAFRDMGVAHERTPISFSAVREVASFTLPSSFQQAVMYVARLAVSPIVNGLGAAATAGYTVVLKVYNICSCIYFNSSKALQSHTAQCVGAGKLDRARKGLVAALVQNAVFVTPVILACALFAEPIAMLFFKEDVEPQALGYALEFMRIFLPFAYLNVIGNVFHGFFKSLGATREVVGATVVGSAAQIVFGIVLAHWFGMTGVFVGWVLSWAVDGGFGVLMYKKGLWKKRLKVLMPKEKSTV